MIIPTIMEITVRNNYNDNDVNNDTNASKKIVITMNKK